MQQGIVAFAFGLVFIGVMLYIALKVPNPTDSQWFTFRVILALAVGGVGAVLPGALDVTVALFDPGRRCACVGGIGFLVQSAETGGWKRPRQRPAEA